MKRGLADERGKLGGTGSVRDPCGFGPDKARRHVSSCSWPAPYRSARPPNWEILLRPARIRVKGLVMAPCAKFPNPLLSCE